MCGNLQKCGPSHDFLPKCRVLSFKCYQQDILIYDFSDSQTTPPVFFSLLTHIFIYCPFLFCFSFLVSFLSHAVCNFFPFIPSLSLITQIVKAGWRTRARNYSQQSEDDEN